jgi:hypothetical protein
MISINGVSYKIICSRTDGTTLLLKDGELKKENKMVINSFDLVNMIAEGKAIRV